MAWWNSETLLRPGWVVRVLRPRNRNRNRNRRLFLFLFLFLRLCRFPRRRRLGQPLPWPPWLHHPPALALTLALALAAVVAPPPPPAPAPTVPALKFHAVYGEDGSPSRSRSEEGRSGRGVPVGY